MVRWGEGDPNEKAYPMWSGFEGIAQEAIFWKKPYVTIRYKQMKRKITHSLSEMFDSNENSGPRPVSSMPGICSKPLL